MTGPVSRRAFARSFAAGGAAALAGGRLEAALAAAPALPPATAPRDEAFWKAVRAQFLLPEGVAHLNAANLCPAPAPVLAAVVNATDLDHDLSPPNRERMHAAKEETRKALAEYLRASPEEILVTRNTSESNNLVSSGLDLRAGDEVLVFSDNHPSNLQAWQEKGRRFGYAVRVLPTPHPHPGPEAYVALVDEAISPRTRVLGFSHLTNTVGDLLPARELCRLARGRGVLSLVDGAQSFGLMDVDLSDMQPDFYSGSAHKWPCGPKETGLLYVRRDVQDRLWPSVVSAYEGQTPLAKRFEGLGQRDEPALLGFAETVRFAQRLGPAAVEARARALGRRLAEALRRLEGVTVWTSPDPARMHAVVSFRPGGLDPARLQAALYEKHGVVGALRAGADRGGLRLSPHFYNSPDEIDRAVAAISGHLAHGVRTP
jgi:selenocysteine lyase/cysteine desulfurase